MDSSSGMEIDDMRMEPDLVVVGCLHDPNFIAADAETWGPVWPDDYITIQYLAIYNNDNLLSNIKMPKVGTKVCQSWHKSVPNTE